MKNYNQNQATVIGNLIAKFSCSAYAYEVSRDYSLSLAIYEDLGMSEYGRKVEMIHVGGKENIIALKEAIETFLQQIEERDKQVAAEIEKRRLENKNELNF